MAKSNYDTNTGHRFISKAKTAFKIHIHCPDDTVMHRSVGYIKIGEQAGLKKAIALRNKLGKEMWGRHWKRVLTERDLFTRLPHSLEPRIIYKPNPRVGNPDHKEPFYLASWHEKTSDGKSQYRSKLASINRYGKLAAYNITKRALQDAYADVIDIVLFMNRATTVTLK